MTAGRSRSLRAQLSRTLVGLGLVSVVLLATVNFVVVRSLLDETARNQLTTLRDLRRDGIEDAVARVRSRVAVLGADPGVAAALADLGAGYEALGDGPDLSDDELAQLESTYDDVVRPFDEAGVERPSVDDLLPSSTAGRTVQHRYIADNPFPAGERADLLDAGDGSQYTDAHVEHHEFLRGIADLSSASELLLVSAASDEVVYSVQKRVDLGTSVVSGPHVETGLGIAWDRLESTSVTDAVVVDAAFYLPDASVPIFHVASTVRQGTQVIGAIVVEVSIEALTELVTEGQQWDLLGLGETGDVFVVGADRRLRSVPRSWFEDPDGYVDRFLATGGSDRSAGLMQFTGSPVLIHEIDNSATETAIGGEQFIGIVDNGLDRRTLAASTPLDIDGLDWFVVTEQQTSETRSELVSFLWSTLLLLALLLPVLAVVGVVLARIFARPVTPLVDAAHEIAEGNFDAEVPDLGRNELGDLGHQLEAVAAQLEEHRTSAEAEEARITSMLGSVLPSDLVERVRAGEHDVSERATAATVVSLNLLGLPDAVGVEIDELLDLADRIGDEMRALATRHGVVRIRAASDQLLYVVGADQPDAAASTAVTFAARAIERITAVGVEFGTPLSARAGLAAGVAAAGVLGRRQLAFDMWGDAVDRAVELAEAGPPRSIVVDDGAAASIDDAVVEELLRSESTNEPRGAVSFEVPTTDADATTIG